MLGFVRFDLSAVNKATCAGKALLHVLQVQPCISFSKQGAMLPCCTGRDVSPQSLVHATINSGGKQKGPRWCSAQVEREKEKQRLQLLQARQLAAQAEATAAAARAAAAALGDLEAARGDGGEQADFPMAELPPDASPAPDRKRRRCALLACPHHLRAAVVLPHAFFATAIPLAMAMQALSLWS